MGSVRYEYYNTNDVSYLNIYAANWKAQTFTPTAAHKITSVKLKIFRVLLPGIITVDIRDTDGSAHPTAAVLCSGTTDGDTLTVNTAGEWREIILGDGRNPKAFTKYAIVVRALSGDAGNYVSWRVDNTAPTYAGGCAEESINSGASWTSIAGTDFMFEEWGTKTGRGWAQK